jgi:hypothetical protein
MSRSPARLAAVSLALLLLPAGMARAELINWSFSWAPSTQTLHADAPGAGTVSLASYGGTINSHPGNLVGLAGAYVTYSSQATDAAPDHFSNAPFGLTLTLTDNATHQTGTLTYTGFFSGDLSATSSGLGVTLGSPSAPGLTLGGHFYAVALGPYIAPPYPSTGLPGILVANVTVSDVKTVPEPATLALAGLALPALGLAAWRKRRGRPAVAAA